MGIIETWDPGRTPGETPVIPSFQASGVDGITALVFEPAAWPFPDEISDRETLMRVVHLVSGTARYITVPRFSNLYEWFETGLRDLNIDNEGAFAHLEWSLGYVEIRIRQARRNREYRTTVDPWTIKRVSQFLLGIRRHGWTEWNTRQGRP